MRGATWPIAEPDLLEEIEARLLEMERSGELARLEQEARADARRKLEEPDPAPGIAPAKEERTRLFDPAITVARDIRTPGGVLIAAAGTRVNPLERMTPCPRPAVRRRQAQGRDRLGARARGRERAAFEDRAARRTAAGADAANTAGPSTSTRGGRLAQRFGLRFTPSLVEQAGTQLRITEIPVEDRENTRRGGLKPC